MAKRKRAAKRRNVVAADLRTPKYKPRVVPNKRAIINKRACRNPRGNT